MKKLIILFCIMSMLVSGCASDKTIDGKPHTSYGLLNENKYKDPNIKYELVWGNVIWGAILVETVIAPIYFFGFSIFEPVGKK